MVVATVMLQGVLVEVDCVGVFSGSSSEGFVVVVGHLGLVLWSS